MIKIKVKTSKKDRLYKECYKKNINIYNIDEDNNYVYLLINEDDYKKIKSMWFIKVISKDYYGYKKWLNNKSLLVCVGIVLIVFILSIVLINNYIIKVQIIHENRELKDMLYSSLKEMGIKKKIFVRQLENQNLF